MLMAMEYYFILIRSTRTGEAIGIVKTPKDKTIEYVYHETSSSSPSQGIVGVSLKSITEAEYTTYQVLKLFPTFKWAVRGTNEVNRNLIDLYDPTFYKMTSSWIRRNRLTWPSATKR